MATGPSPATLKFFEDYKRQNTENNLCFECGRQNPQWASVNCGLLICLECSGKHRSIGVHLSFVRSLTMDVWSDRQIAFMQAGGNDKAKEWMERYSVKETDLKSKYSSPAFEAYREKLKAIVENRPYKDPSPEDLIKKASPYTSPYSSRTASPAPYSNGNYNSSSASSGSRSSPNPMSSSGGYGGGSDGRSNDIRSSNGYSNNNGYGNNSYGNNGYNNNNNGYNSYNGNNNGYNNNNNGYNSYNGNSNDMSRLQGRNAIGSSDFQQNNRNNNNNNNNDDDDLMNAFYDGWSKFSSGVKSVASTAAEKVSSGTLTDEVAQWASKVSESETWGFVSSFFSGQDSKSSQQQQQQQQQQQRPPTRDEKSYSSDRPPPPRSSNDHNTEKLDNGGRHQRYDDYSGFEDDRHSIRSQSQGRYDGRSSSHDLRQQPIQNGERHGLRSDPVMPRRPHSNPSRAANGWGDGADDWDDWSADKRKNEVSNPHVASMDDEVQVDDYAHAVAAPKPTRTVANDPHDIYNFQIAPSSGSNPSGQWEEWDDWGPKK